MTGDGPLSMCLHNARRDEFILQPVALHRRDVTVYWQPLTGEANSNRNTPPCIDIDTHTLKHLKGQARQRRQAMADAGSANSSTG